MIARSLLLTGLLVVAGCGSNQTNTLPSGEDGTGGGGTGSGGSHGSTGDAGSDARAGSGSTCAGCNDPPPPADSDAGQDPTPPANPQYLQLCYPAKNPPIQSDCQTGQACVNFDDRGNHCSHTCTQPSDCAAPATGCATSKESGGALYCTPPL